jgi:putative endonuclease
LDRPRIDRFDFVSGTSQGTLRRIDGAIAGTDGVSLSVEEASMSGWWNALWQGIWQNGQRFRLRLGRLRGLLPAPPRAKSGGRQKSLGQRGELAAADYLRGIGYQIVKHGYTTSEGELDLIALDGPVVVYAEVKTLRRCGSRPEAAVDRSKRRQIIRLAQSFAASHGLLHQRSRFDVVAVVWPDPEQPPVIRHYRNAFRDDSRQQGVYRRDH